MSAYRAALFDFFGTLTQAVRRGPAHDGIARSLGCDPVAFSRVLDFSFPGRSRGQYGPAVEALAWIAGRLGAHPTSTQLAQAVSARVVAIRADTRLRPDAVAVLGFLRAKGLRTAVVSDCGPELPEFLPYLPVGPLLDTCVYSFEVGTSKPDPAMYLAACRRLGVSPRECLYVGDGGSRELSGARAAGMTAVRLAAPDLAGHLSFDAEPDWHGPAVRSLTEVAEFVVDDRALAAVG